MLTAGLTTGYFQSRTILAHTDLLIHFLKGEKDKDSETAGFTVHLPWPRYGEPLTVSYVYGDWTIGSLGANVYSHTPQKSYGKF